MNLAKRFVSKAGFRLASRLLFFRMTDNSIVFLLVCIACCHADFNAVALFKQCLGEFLNILHGN